MTSSNSPENKRAFKRVTRQFVMRVRADLKSVVPVWSLVTTQDLSAGGALFTMDQVVHLKEQMAIKIHFLDRVIDCYGRVARLTPGFQKPLVQVGVVFESMQEKDKQFIEQFCSAFKQKPS